MNEFRQQVLVRNYRKKITVQQSNSKDWFLGNLKDLEKLKWMIFLISSILEETVKKTGEILDKVFFILYICDVLIKTNSSNVIQKMAKLIQ